MVRGKPHAISQAPYTLCFPETGSRTKPRIWQYFGIGMQPVRPPTLCQGIGMCFYSPAIYVNFEVLNPGT